MATLLWKDGKCEKVEVDQVDSMIKAGWSGSKEAPKAVKSAAKTKTKTKD